MRIKYLSEQFIWKEKLEIKLIQLKDSQSAFLTCNTSEYIGGGAEILTKISQYLTTGIFFYFLKHFLLLPTYFL